MFVLKNSNSCSNLLRRCVAHSKGLVVKVEIIRDVFGNTWMRERPTGQDNTETRSSPPLRHNSTDNSFCIDAKGRIKLKHMEDEGILTKVAEPTDLCAPIATAFRKNGDVRLCVDLKKHTNCQTGILYAS